MSNKKWELCEQYPIARRKRYPSKVAVYRRVQEIREDVTRGWRTPRQVQVYEDGALYESFWFPEVPNA